MLRLISLSIIIMIFTACSTSKTIKIENPIKTLNSININKNEKTILELDIEKISSNLSSNFTSNKYSSYIDEMSSFLYKSGEKEYLSQKQLALTKKRHEKIVNKLFTFRLQLRNEFYKISKKQNIEDRCLSSIRKAYRYLRFLEEFVTEIGLENKKQKANQDIFSNKKHQLFLNPKYLKFELKEGDILLLRSATFVGATIARIGDDDGQFSHGALVYKDKDGKTMILESLIDKGLVSKTFEEWVIENRSARIVQFRVRSNNAKELMRSFYNKTKNFHNNRKIKYDFQMDDKTKNELFCSELIQHTYSSLGVPTFKTKFDNFTNHSFLKKLTIETNSAFSPNDIEVEPKFELISEWRNYELTQVARIQDAVMSSFMKWMSKENYELNTTFRSIIGSNLGYYGRHLFGLNKEQIPSNMPFGFLKTIIQLNDLNTVLEEYMFEKNKKHIEKYSYPMTYPKMIVELESLRKKDLENYKFNKSIPFEIDKHKEVVFHHLIN